MSFSKAVSVLLVVGAFACGKVTANPEDANTGDGSGGGDAPTDAAVPRFARVFHTMPQGQGGQLFAADITEGVVAAARLLSGTPTNTTANPTNVMVSRDSNTIIYVSDAEVEGRNELYYLRFVNGTPSAPVKINGLHAGMNAMVFYSALAPDGSHAVYGWGINNGLSITYLGFYYVDLSGGTPGTPKPIATGTNLANPSTPLNLARFAYDDLTSPCGVYVADISTSTPGAPVKVNGTGTTNTSCSASAFSPDGNRMAYVSDILSDDVFDMWLSNTSAATATPAVKVNGALVLNGDVVQGYFGAAAHIFSPDSKKLFYLADATTDSVNELWMSDVSGATPATARKVNDTLVTGGAVSDGSSGAIIALPFVLSRDSKKLAYLADQRTNDVFELFLVDISGSTPGVPQLISGALATGGNVSAPQFAPDGSGIAFPADARTNDVVELFYVDLRGTSPSAPQVVNGTFGAMGDLTTAGLMFAYAFSPDGKKLAYCADQTQDTFNDYYVSDVSSGTPSTAQAVHHSTTANGFPFKTEFTADSKTLVYMSNPAGTYDVWAAEVGGASPGTPARVNTTPGPVSGVVPNFWLAPL
jgi:Tol biopolymer transport system component